MNAHPAVGSDRPAPPSFWSRLKVPAILLLIGINLLVFGGNAVIDIWQTFGPGKTFSGVIAGHERQVTKGENSQQFLIVTIDSQQEGTLQFDVPQHTFDDTSVGQAVTGEHDSFGFSVLDHDEALRALTADGKAVLRTHAVSRVVNGLIIFAVVSFVCAITIRWVVSRNRRRQTQDERVQST